MIDPSTMSTEATPPLTAQVSAPSPVDEGARAAICSLVSLLENDNFIGGVDARKILEPITPIPGSSPTPETQPAGTEREIRNAQKLVELARQFIEAEYAQQNEDGDLISDPRARLHHDHLIDVEMILQTLLSPQTQQPAGTERVEGEYVPPPVPYAEHEREMLKQIEERDEAEEALSQAYYIVLGRSPEWSNVLGHKEALEEIEEAVELLKDAARPSHPQPPQPSQATEPKRESFAEAVMNSGMTEAQQAPLLTMAVEEKAHQIVSCWLSDLEGYDAVTRGTPKLIKAVAQAITEARFAPMGDNHHNAAACPYCSPKLPPKESPEPKQGVARGGEWAEAWRQKARAARAEADRIHATVKGDTGAEERCRARAGVWEQCAAELDPEGAKPNG